MEGKRRHKGEQLIITKKRVELTRVFKRKAKVEIEVKSFSKWEKNSEAGNIDKVKGGSMTQEEELKIGEVG